MLRTTLPRVTVCHLVAAHSLWGRLFASKAPPTSPIAHVTGENYDEVVTHSSIPVLLDLFATWCGPCRTLSPVLEKLATTLHGKVKICKVDVDESPDVADRFHVKAVPTVVLLRGSQQEDSFTGAMSEENVLQWLKRHEIG